MCGIAGYLGPSEISLDKINRCLSLMTRRGPNARGNFVAKTPSGKNIVLLHSRLAVLDLDPRSNQPYLNGKTAMIFNGEIYNYIELKENLAAKYGDPLGGGDTVVLNELIKNQGIKSINQCEGMWALAYYDGNNGNLYLARDRFGEKPLFIHRDTDGSVYFASEIKFIFALLGRQLPINFNQIKRYLVNGYKSLYKTKDTFYEGIEELSPGRIALCSEARLGLQDFPYWTPNFKNQKDDMSFEEAVKGTRERLIRSVELRLRSDVPVAFCLSGGIDSNALIAVAKRELGQEVHGFTIINTDERYDERDLVELSIKELDLKHTAVSIDTNNFLENLSELIEYHDAPIFTLTYYAQWRLMKKISSAGYKVSISGTGADELFSGYYDHHNAYLAYMYGTDNAGYQNALRDWAKKQANIVRNPFLKNHNYFIDNPLSREHIYLDSEIFSQYLIEPFFEPFLEIFFHSDLLRNRMANELTTESVPVILHEDDLNAMYFSVENRSPFLDTSLFDWSVNIPTKHLIKNGVAKSVLRESVRNLVPEEILDNPRKVGFNAPIEGYLDLNDLSVTSYILSDSPIYELVRKDKVAELITCKDLLTNSQSKFLFNLVNIKIFLEKDITIKNFQ